MGFFGQTVAGPARIDTSGFDSDALAYISAVETADGQQLENYILSAINTFISGLKTDNVWADIEAACILSGARTLTGALTPLKGSAPTSYNFVSSDYIRFGGLRGNGSTKYIDSGRANNASGTQDDFHMAFYASIYRNSTTAQEVKMGCGLTSTTGCTVFRTGGANVSRTSNRRCRNTAGDIFGTEESGSRFVGQTRDNSSNYIGTTDETNPTITRASQTPAAGNIYVFATNNAGVAAEYDGHSRIMFYSIGTATTLTSIRDRLFTFIDSIRGT